MDEPAHLADQPARPTAEPAATADDGRAEFARLPAEHAAREVADRPAVRPRRTGWWRTLVATVCIVLAGILAPLAIVSVWARAEVTDTDRYVQTMAPLASDPAVQAAATDAVTNAIVQRVDIKSLTDQAFGALGSKGILPPALSTALQGLSQPVVDGITNFIHSTVAKFVARPQFASAWEAANRSAHQQLVDTLSGDGQGAVSISHGQVSIQLATVINTVKQQLVDAGFGLAAKIPEVNATFTIFSSPDVDKLQTAYRLLNTAGYVLPIVCLVLLAVGLYVAKSQRRAVIGAGLTAFLAAGLLALGLAYGRHAYLTSVTSAALPRDAATAIFDTLVRFLRDGIRNVAIVGLAVALGAFLLGPSVTGRRSRQLCVNGIGRLRNGLERLGLHLAKVTGWVAPHARLLRVLAVVAVGLTYALWTYRTPAVTLWLIVVLLILLVVIQLLASPAPARHEPATGDGGPAAVEPPVVTAHVGSEGAQLPRS